MTIILILTFAVILGLVTTLRNKRSQLIEANHKVFQTGVTIGGVKVVFVKDFKNVLGFEKVDNLLYIDFAKREDGSFIAGAYHSSQGRLFQTNRLVRYWTYPIVVTASFYFVGTENFQGLIGIVALAVLATWTTNKAYVHSLVETMYECYPKRKQEDLNQYVSKLVS